MKTVFYRCNICGNIVVKVVNSGAPVSCCGEEMEELVPMKRDDGYEKHLPVVTHVNENTVRVHVGSRDHPMMSEHYIQFIYLKTEHGGQLAYLFPSDPPEAVFCVRHDKPVGVFIFCNIHGLWYDKCQC